MGTTCLLIGLLLAAACASRPAPAAAPSTPPPPLPEERRFDARLAAFLASPRERAALSRGRDPLAALDAFWARRDPTPDTPENEALAVYRQRGAYLEARFPDTAPGEMTPHWQLFLRYGQPDLEGWVNQPWRARIASRIPLPQVTPSAGADERFMHFTTPRAFTVVFDPQGTTRYTGSYPPTDPPDLARAWRDLTDPGSSIRRRSQALDLIAWYELPEVISRLLSVPTVQFEGLAEQRESMLSRLAVRAAYTLPVEDARRLAALRAAGGSPDYLLFRVRPGRYSAAELREDLTRLALGRAGRFALERVPERGPHVELWLRPEILLAQLPNFFPSEETVTGWDWRGDLYLACGPPSWLIPNEQVALFVWGTPEVIGISGTAFGQVESHRIEDTLGDFVAMSLEATESRRREGDEAAATLARALRSGEDSERQSMLEHLHTLAPPPIYQVGQPAGALKLPLTMDVVAFPAGGDSIEVQASFGMPSEAVFISSGGQGYTTSLRTSFVLLDARMQVVFSEVRSRGYLVEGEAERADRFVLDTFRFRTVPGFYVAYLSAEDPVSGRSGGILQSLDFEWQKAPGVQVSPIMIATEISETSGSGKFVRNGLRILPAPSRDLYYGADLHFYFEIGNLARSEYGDHVWQESYYIIPTSPTAGIIRVTQQQDFTRLVPTAVRQMQIDLSSHEGSYTGALFLVVVITDTVSGNQGVGVTRFTLHSRGNEPPL